MTRYGPHDPDTVPQLVTIRGRSGEHQVPVDPAITRQRAAINNLAAGVAARDAVLPQVAAAGDQDVRHRLTAAVRRLAATGREFSMNDLRDELPDVSGPMVGAVFGELAAAGVIAATDRFVRSTKRNTKGHRIGVWIGAA